VVIGVLYSPVTSTEGDENEEEDNENASNSAAASASAGARRHGEEQQQTGTSRCNVAQTVSSQNARVREVLIHSIARTSGDGKKWKSYDNFVRVKKKQVDEET